MKRYLTALTVIVLVLCGMVSVAAAADYPGSTTTSTTMPQIVTAEGLLSGGELPNNSLKVTDSTGKIWNLAINRKATTA